MTSKDSFFVLKFIYKFGKFTTFLFNTFSFESRGKIINKTGLRDYILSIFFPMLYFYSTWIIRPILSIDDAYVSRTFIVTFDLFVRMIASCQYVMRLSNVVNHKLFHRILVNLQRCDKMVSPFLKTLKYFFKFIILYSFQSTITRTRCHLKSF